MTKKPTYEELEQRVKELEKAESERKHVEDLLQKSEGKYRTINKQLQQEIIERQQAQEQLALFHQFVEASREGMGWADLDGRVRYINSTLCSMFGETKPKDSYGRPVLEYYSEETQRRLQEEIFPTVLREGTWTGELVIHSSTGNLIPTTNSLIVLRDAEGNPSSFANVLTDLTERKQAEDELRRHRDNLEEIVAERTSALKKNNQKLQREITDRKQAEEALRESEDRYRSIIENASVGIFQTTPDGRYLSANRAGYEMWGFSSEEEMIEAISDLATQTYVNAEHRKRFKEIIERKGRVENFEAEFYTKDKIKIWCSLNSRAIYGDGGQVKYYETFIQNITDRKRAEEALRESEEKHRTALEASPDPFVVYDKGGKVIYFNPAFTQVFGWSLEERLGKKMDLFVPEDAWPETRMMIEKVLEGERFSNIETRRHTKNGENLPVSISGATYRDRSGNLLGSVINFRDISEQKKLEGQLQQAQRMEAMGTLAGGIAHDFNNLLMGIQGRTSLMLMDTDASHSHLEHLQGIEDYIKSAADLTKQLLGFARGGKYEIRPTDLNELIINENRMFGRTRKEINIQEKFEQNLWTVEVDQRQIEQALLNIYVNAWQAMPGGGNLYIQTENVIIDEDYIKPYQVEPGNYVKISITDTGVGMDETTQQRIFDPFFTTKEMGRGTGLGLASAYGIIKNHNGFINVYSEKDEGTTFNIYLPASEKEAVKEKEPNEELFKGTETLLLVDDEDMIMQVGQRVIGKLGYKVLTAKSGKEAIEIYEKNRGQIDMVILDMIMPNMGGGETYDKLKEINPDIKVLLSSGYSINGQATDILEQGCNGFIQKPFNMGALSKKIREILDKD